MGITFFLQVEEIAQLQKKCTELESKLVRTKLELQSKDEELLRTRAEQDEKLRAQVKT